MAIWDKITTITTPAWTSVSEITTPSWESVTILNSITYLLRNAWEGFTIFNWEDEVRRWDDLTN